MKAKYKIWRFRGQSEWYLDKVHYLGPIPIWWTQEAGRQYTYGSVIEAEKEANYLMDLHRTEPFIVTGKVIIDEQGQ